MQRGLTWPLHTTLLHSSASEGTSCIRSSFHTLCPDRNQILTHSSMPMGPRTNVSKSTYFRHAGEKQRPRPKLLIRSFSSLTFYFLFFQNLIISSSCFDQPCSVAKVNLASLFLSRVFPFVSLLWFICQVFPNMKSVFPIFRELPRFCERGLFVHSVKPGSAAEIVAVDPRFGFQSMRKSKPTLRQAREVRPDMS